VPHRNSVGKHILSLAESRNFRKTAERCGIQKRQRGNQSTSPSRRQAEPVVGLQKPALASNFRDRWENRRRLLQSQLGEHTASKEAIHVGSRPRSERFDRIDRRLNRVGRELCRTFERVSFDPCWTTNRKRMQTAKPGPRRNLDADRDPRSNPGHTRTAPLAVAWAKPTGKDPKRFSNGRSAPKRSGDVWRSGPAAIVAIAGQRKSAPAHACFSFQKKPSLAVGRTNSSSNLRAATRTRSALSVTPIPGHAVRGWRRPPKELETSTARQNHRTQRPLTSSDRRAPIARFHRCPSNSTHGDAKTVFVIRSWIYIRDAIDVWSPNPSTRSKYRIQRPRAAPRGNWQDESGEPRGRRGFPSCFLPGR